jgi:hypothetical protein
MRQIRHGVFETNSSSTHSLTICSDEEYKKFESGELVCSAWSDELLPPDTFDDNNDYYTFEKFFNGCYDDLETFNETYTTKGGEVIHVFGKYGYDG